MSTAFEDTPLPGVKICRPDLYGDARGFFTETFHQARYAAAGIDVAFVQDNLSRSVRGTLRGLHYQLKHPQAKLVSVLQGEVLDVAVDIRKGSPNFGKYYACRLNDQTRHQLFIPGGFAHGFCVLSETADFYYKCSEVYQADDQYGLVWNDADLGIDWEVKDPFLSEKDQILPSLGALPEDDLPVYP
jgi:dTDP-4-dehydrorhamnose 3,5-epimerase